MGCRVRGWSKPACGFLHSFPWKVRHDYRRVLLEEVVTVEAKHYPNDPKPRAQPVGEVIASTAKFALAVVIILNLLCLPLYSDPNVRAALQPCALLPAERISRQP